jgi:steroid delta-isomerase-like uncharacterized protein
MSEAADLVRRWWEEVWNQRKVEVADEILAPDFVVHVFWSNPGLAGPRDVPGIEPSKEVIQLWARAFPDFHVTIEKLIDAGDAVACAHIFHCTSLGEMNGQPPTGKTAAMPGLTMMRVENGKIKEAWTCWDMLGGLQQLEMFPPLGAAGPLGMAKFAITRVRNKIRYKRGKTPVGAQADGKPADA